jgi:glycosyltransferase involved in cell wall biosynthesis
MKRIGIDANCLLYDQSGFGRYTSNLIKNILKNDSANEYFLYANFIRKSSQRKKILSDFIYETKAKNVHLRILSLPSQWKEIISGTNFPYSKIMPDSLDLYFSPHFAGIPRNGFNKQVVTIHDLVFLKYPEHRGTKLSRYYLKRTKIAIEKSDKIIAVSLSTKKDLIELLQVPKEKIQVIYEGADDNFRVIADARTTTLRTKKYVDLKTKYILSVGNLEPRKNLSVIIKAFSLLPLNLQQQYKIVFVGGKGWNNQELAQTIDDYNLSGKIIFTGYVPDKDLPYLYNRAAVFIYPSLYEGFGLPVLEAMSCGTPVITSNLSSLPEIVGRAGILVNPKNEQELAGAIKNILERPKMALSMKKKGLLQAKKFSWQKAAKETLKVFKKVTK